MVARTTTTIEHDRERMTVSGMMFNSGRESWSWRSSRKLPCVVDHANLTCLQHMGRLDEEECLPNRNAKVKTSWSRTSGQRAHNLQ